MSYESHLLFYIRELHTLHRVHDHFFPKLLHPEFGSQCCKYTLTEPHAPKMHMHTPSTANAFWGHNIEDCTNI